MRFESRIFGRQIPPNRDRTRGGHEPIPLIAFMLDRMVPPTFAREIKRLLNTRSVFPEVIQIRALAESFKGVCPRADRVQSRRVHDSEKPDAEAEQHDEDNDQRHGLQDRETPLIGYG